MLWRLVTNKIASLHEIESHWSLDDILDANEVLDIQQEAQDFYQRELDSKRRKV